MSSRITIKSSPALGGGGLVAIIVGLLMLVGGGIAWAMVSQQLSAERIYVAEDAAFFQGQLVNNPIAAYAQADVINKHALEASGGLTYSELAQDDPTRAVVMNAAFLRSSLFTSVVSFGVALLAMGTGLLFMIVGWSMRKASIGNPVVVETDSSGPVQIANTKGKDLSGFPAEGTSSTDGNETQDSPAPVGPVGSGQPQVPAPDQTQNSALTKDPATSRTRAQARAERAQLSESAQVDVPAVSSDTATPASGSDSKAAAFPMERTHNEAELPVRNSALAASPMPRRVPTTTFPNARSSQSAVSAADVTGAQPIVGFSSSASPASDAGVVVGTSVPETTVGFAGDTATQALAAAPVAVKSAEPARSSSSPLEGLTGSWSKPSTIKSADESASSSVNSAPEDGGSSKLDTPTASGTKPETLPTPVVHPTTVVQSATAAQPAPAAQPTSASQATPASPSSSPMGVVSPQVVYGSGQTPLPTRSSRSARSAVSASTGSFPTIPSFDELISPSNSSSLGHASRSDRVLSDSRKRAEDQRNRTGMTGTIPIVGENRVVRTDPPVDMSQETGTTVEEPAFVEPKPVTGAVSWLRPQDRLK